ncbi:helix-turn-helix domain-containing protein [Streptomyces microflavus]|uniref:helix-turn-helix domain-containing protein n=1 Tax=Streptomyces microflavus TaxID=1919 RepID=UPI0036BAE2AF
MDAATGASDEVELAEVVAAIDELLALVERGREVIDFEGLTRKTGIPGHRVVELLDGIRPTASPDPSVDEHQVFVERLKFLRETRLSPAKKMFTQDEIATGAQISHGQVGYLLKGQRTPRFDVAAKLERFFDVSPGFFTASEHRLLREALIPILDDLKALALLKGLGVTQIAMRSSAAGGGSSTIASELQTALAVALTQEPARDKSEDAEVQELTDRLSSLPKRSRSHVMGVIRGVLGLVPVVEDDNKGPDGHASTTR